MGEASTTLRIFIAIEVPGAIGQMLMAAKNHLEPFTKDLGWVSPQNIHLTLKFLGNVAEADLVCVVDAVKRVAQNANVFRLSTLQVGGGPRSDKARVVWLSVGGETANLSAVQDEIETEMEALGFARERRKFYPHLTLARARRKPVCLPDGIESLVNPVHFMVERLVVFKSDLRPEGPVYTPLGYGTFCERVRAGANPLP